VDPVLHTCTLDVGAADVSGNPVYLEDVPFQPQTPPGVGDKVSLTYGNASPHSVAVGGGALSGQNAQSSLQVVGAVTSLAAAGGGTPLQGPVLIAGAGTVAVSESGATITVTGSGVVGITAESGGGAAVGPESVINFVAGANVSSVVVTDNAAAHRIDVTINAATQTVTAVNSLNTLTGAVTLAAGANISLGVVGNTITINASSMMAGVDVGSGGAMPVGPQQVINFVNGSNMSIGVVNNIGSSRLDVTLTAAGGGGVPVWPVTMVPTGTAAYTARSTDVVIFCFTETIAQTITLPSAVGMEGKIYVIFNAYQGSSQGLTVAATAPSTIVGITTLGGSPQRRSAWYLSDGSNWHSFDNSGGN
jgi:hypothetical protein